MAEDDKTRKHVEYDDIYNHVKSFGTYQKKVAYGTCVILIGQGIQFAHLQFVTGSPKFKCSTPNVTCEGINKCCTNCTSYEFDTMYTTIVSEVSNMPLSISILSVCSGGGKGRYSPP